jgi:hypothetical protein
MKNSRATDLLVRDCGMLWQFFPLSKSAADWIDMNVQEEPWQWIGRSLVVDWRFVEPLINGPRAAGLDVTTS